MKKIVIKYVGKDKNLYIEDFIKDFDFNYIRTKCKGKLKSGNFIIKIK